MWPDHVRSVEAAAVTEEEEEAQADETVVAAEAVVIEDDIKDLADRTTQEEARTD